MEVTVGLTAHLLRLISILDQGLGLGTGTGAIGESDLVIEIGIVTVVIVIETMDAHQRKGRESAREPDLEVLDAVRVIKVPVLATETEIVDKRNWILNTFITTFKK